ncbi:MAG: lytic murein transglycosylase [Chloroflexi bacterium]|nr:lytic murein transglycosylase [Chloroflexota bacterium]
MTHARRAMVLVLAIVAAACGATAPTQGSLAVTSPTAAPTPVPSVEPTATPIPSPVATPTPEPDYTKQPDVAHDLVPLIEQVIMAERGIRDPSVTGAKLQWMGWLQQLTYGQLANFPEWVEPLIKALPADLRPGVQGTIDAGKELRRLKGPTPKTFPDWKIVEPKPIDALMGFYQKAEAEYGVPWYYLAAVNLVETRMGRIRGLSSAGAQGPMQFMPGTWAAYGKGDVNDEHDAIMGAANYLKASGAPRDMDRALFAYNRHIGYVNAIKGYAEVMRRDPNAYRGYHGWQVYYPTVEGIFHLAPGWTKPPD